MTVRVERAFELDATPERVWAFMADPAKRAGAISVVTDYTVHEDNGQRGTWHIELPIPLIRRTITVETEDLVVRPPEYVKYIGRSKVMTVTGEHEIEATENGARLTNKFTVDGTVPGVEKFFRRNLDDELENLKRALEDDIRSQRHDE